MFMRNSSYQIYNEIQFSILVMMTLTSGDYESQYWPKLEEAINHLLTMVPGQGIPISYEQMYR